MPIKLNCKSCFILNDAEAVAVEVVVAACSYQILLCRLLLLSLRVLACFTSVML